MNTKEDSDLKIELEKSRKEIKKLEDESNSLKKAIWDVLNYSNLYIVLLDSKMNIRLISWSLANDLGYDNEKDLVGRCWLDFVPQDNKDIVKNIHHSLSNLKETKYREVTTDIFDKDKNRVTIKWFNLRINSNYNLTFSMGLKVSISMATINEETIRSYYKDIIEKDRTMIQSLRDIVTSEYSEPVTCEN